MFKNLPLRLKLILPFMLIAMLLAAVSYYQIGSMRYLDTLFSNLIDQEFNRLDTLETIAQLSGTLRDDRVQYQQAVIAHETPDSLARQKATVSGQITDLQGHVQTYIDLTKLDSQNVTPQIVAAISSNTQKIVKDTQRILDNTTDTASQADLRTAQKGLDQAIGAAVTVEREGIAHEDSKIDKTVFRLILVVVVLAIAVTAVAALLGLLVAGWIGRSLARLKDGAQRLANGDFSRFIPATSQDEMGQLSNAFNHMAGRLRDSYGRLAMERQRDEAMLQSMGEGLIAIDKEGDITVVNRVAAGYLGMDSTDAIIGKPLQEAYTLFDPQDKDKPSAAPLPRERRPGLMALATGQTVSALVAMPSSEDNGKMHLFSITATPVKLNEEAIGAVTVLRDVTKEKEIDRMKTEFISLASHQLRTPLSAIKWFTEMLLSGDAGELEPDQKDFAQNIADSTERMIALVNALLNISRIESGRIMVDPKPTDLHELVAGIVADLKGKTEQKKQSLIISVHEDLPKINLDPRLIGQVYLNLLTNAIKYTPKGGEISVFISKKDDQVISQITDNGYGIPKEQQHRIFQKFFRATNAVKVETDGTGLGLYLIKAVVESSGGEIWFKSEEGKGTTFWFSIPLSGMKPKEGEVTLDA